MDARSMVFDTGDRVTGCGRLVADDDGEWLDLPGVGNMEYPGWRQRRTRPRSPHAVALTGADVAAVPTEFGPNGTKPGVVTIVGIWRDGAIDVESQSPYGQPDEPSSAWTTPPCPHPPGGWPLGDGADTNLSFDLGDLQTTGAAISVVTFRPSPNQAVLVIAATDIEAVEAVLRPQLPDRLCVVPSRYTRAQLDDVRAYLDHHWADWQLISVGESADEHAQRYIHVTLYRVTRDLADWADMLPTSILVLTPWLTPARDRLN